MKYTVLNKHLMVSENGGTARMLPNIYETVKAECIADSKGKLRKYLPYLRVYFSEYDFPDLAQWRGAFSSDNPPGKLIFNSKLEEYLQDVDFSKPYDPVLVERIRKHFVSGISVKIDVDYDLMAQSDVGGLDQ